jgi:hypothetical protein
MSRAHRTHTTATDIQRAASALLALPADCDRDAWVKVGMAAKEAGIEFDIFDRWSATAPDHYNPSAARDAWRSFKTGKGVGAGTLFHMARANGWQDDGHAPALPPKPTAGKRTTHSSHPTRPAPGMAPSEVWARCEPATDGHPYVRAKNAQGAPLDGLRVLPKNERTNIQGQAMGGALVVPAYGPDGTLQSLQLIPATGSGEGTGKKMNLPGAPMSGASFAVGEVAPHGPLYLCEGLGTAWAVWQASGCAAVVCFGWGNVSHIAKDMRSRYPDALLVLCPDAGKEAPAKAIASEVHQTALACLPVGAGGECWPKNSDLWDYAQQEGLDALALLLEQVQKPTEPAPGVPRINPTFPALEDEWMDEEPGTTEDEEPEPDPDPHRNAPQPSADCLYGLVGDVARAAHQANREVNAHAAALGFMVALAAGMGRGPFLRLGDDWHHPRLFALHVGRSGRGRKGTAFKLTRRILKRLEERYTDVFFQNHTGGLSSREGLVMMIHDGYSKGTGKNTEEVPAVADKRLFILESEFVNVLHQAGREGNTLSAALRDAWDGQGIKPAIKNNAIGVGRPHINLMGHITPGELTDCMKTRELSNGFANRFMVIWAEQPARHAFPPGTPDEVVNALTERMAEVLRFAGAARFVDHDSLPMHLNTEARSMYQALYEGELSRRTGGDRMAGLLERRAPMLLRLAMIFALCDLSREIAPPHINAALSWVRYWEESVAFIFASAKEEAKAEQTSDAAARILDYLHQNGEATRTELTNVCFQKRANKEVMDAALDELLKANPARIVVEVRKIPGAVRPAKVYKIPRADFADFADFGVDAGFFHDSEGVRSLRTLRTLENPTSNGHTKTTIEPKEQPSSGPNSANSANSATWVNGQKTLTPRQTPQSPHGVLPEVPIGADAEPY